MLTFRDTTFPPGGKWQKKCEHNAKLIIKTIQNSTYLARSAGWTDVFHHYGPVTLVICRCLERAGGGGGEGAGWVSTGRAESDSHGSCKTAAAGAAAPSSKSNSRSSSNKNN